MVYCVAQAHLFFGIEIDEELYDYDEIEELIHEYGNKKLEIVFPMMGQEEHKMFLASKVFESDDMELILIDLAEEHIATPDYAFTLRDFIQEHLPKIEYKDKLIGWKLISTAYSST